MPVLRIKHRLRTAFSVRKLQNFIPVCVKLTMLFPDMLGGFAEFETNLRRVRQFEGINAAWTTGVYKGRKATTNAVELRRLPDEEKLDPTAIARRLGIGRASVYRVLGKAKVPASA